MELKSIGQAALMPPNFAPLMLLQTRTTIVPDWKELLTSRGIGNVEGAYQIRFGRIMARSNSSEVRQLDFGSESDLNTFFLKKYWVNKSSQLWKGMFRGTLLGRSKVRREFNNLNQLRELGLDAPEPVAFGEERYAGWLLRSFLVSRGIADAVPLDTLIRDRFAALPRQESIDVRRTLIENLALSTRRLHQIRFVHHDLFWRNILVSGQNLKQFFLIDAHKGRRWLPGWNNRNRAKDLAALDSPATAYFRQTERLRFFLLYRGHRRIEEQDKKLIRLSLELAKPLRETQLRRVRNRGTNKID